MKHCKNCGHEEPHCQCLGMPDYQETNGSFVSTCSVQDGEGVQIERDECDHLQERVAFVTDEMVEAVEELVGMGTGAWDMVNPKEIFAAVLIVAQNSSAQAPKG